MKNIPQKLNFLNCASIVSTDSAGTLPTSCNGLCKNFFT
jgi:hypothetical protein